ncbi:MAG: energy transducer TonB [Bacteroidia bacterium]|nr:energy transducer TonB [Bacteroidia bacterium]
MKRKVSVNAILKWLTILPMIAIVIAVVPSCKGKTKPAEIAIEEITSPPSPLPYNVTNGDTIWFRVDCFPVFPGGSEALSNFLGKNMSYPESAKKKKIQGRVVVGFILTKDCKVVDAKIVTGIDPDCDNEALRVVNSLPQFEKPAYVKGRPVAYHFTLPVHYTLK